MGGHPYETMDIIRDALRDSRSWLDSNPSTPGGTGAESPSLTPLLQDDHCTPELNGNFNGGCVWKENLYPEWVRVKTIVDSGAAMSIAPPSMARGVRIEESEMSSKGQSFIGAGAQRIANQGQQTLRITTNEGRQGLTRYQIWEVNRPLMAVSQTCDAGNHVLFTSDGGYVYNPVDGGVTRFERTNNVYELGMWNKSSDANGKPQAQAVKWMKLLIQHFRRSRMS